MNTAAASTSEDAALRDQTERGRDQPVPRQLVAAQPLGYTAVPTGGPAHPGRDLHRAGGRSAPARPTTVRGRAPGDRSGTGRTQ